MSNSLRTLLAIKNDNKIIHAIKWFIIFSFPILIIFGLAQIPKISNAIRPCIDVNLSFNEGGLFTFVICVERKQSFCCISNFNISLKSNGVFECIKKKDIKNFDIQSFEQCTMWKEPPAKS